MSYYAPPEDPRAPRGAPPPTQYPPQYPSQYPPQHPPQYTSQYPPQYPPQQHVAYSAMGPAPYSDHVGGHGLGMTTEIMQFEYNGATAAAMHQAYTAPRTPEPTCVSSPSYAPNTPDSTITASSYSSSEYSTDYTDHSDADVDAMVDAAMQESGLFTSALLSDEHIGLDAGLMQEMEELARNRESYKSRQQLWHLYELEPSRATSTSSHTSTSTLSLPQTPPSSPWNPTTVTAAAGWTVPASPLRYQPPRSPTLFTPPSGDGWQVRGNESTMEDTEMDESENDDGMLEDDTKELELLMREIKFLDAQKEFLVYKASLTSPAENKLSAALIHRRDAIQEKQKLVEAKLLKDMFTNAINHQFENLKYVQQQLLESPLTHYRTTLVTPMESFIHLTKDPKERRAKLMEIYDDKIDTAQRFLAFQSRNIDVERDFFYLDTFEKFGKFYTVDFSISKLEDTTVDDVAFVFYFHFVYTKDRISKILGSVENREYFDGKDWVFLHGRFVDRINLLKRSKRHGRSFHVQESNTVFYTKKVGDVFVLTCDNIDKDELHPYRSRGRIRQDMVFGVVIEPYVDTQGKESVILKRFSFYRHHFNNIEPSPEVLQAISTKIILWGQAVRMCVSSREKDRLPIPLSRKPLKRAGAPMVLTNWATVHPTLASTAPRRSMTLADATSRALQRSLETAQVQSALEHEPPAALDDGASSDPMDAATNDGSTTNSDGGGGDDAVATQVRMAKKRRSTHQVRKEEKEALQEQIAMLQSRLSQLEDEHITDKLELHRAVAKHTQLVANVEMNHMAMAGTQSMLSSYTNADWQSPLSTYIHLTCDPVQRAQCLEAIHARKIDLTSKFLLERSRFLDLRREHCHTESSELPNGDFVFTRFDVTPFGRENSPKRVFDEMIHYLSHQEISISEDLGILTIVDAEDVMTPAVRHNRLVSILGDGLEVESNAVIFQKYVHVAADGNGIRDESYGVGCIDYVDRDDLYPVDASVRLSKDLTAGGFVAACPTDRSDAPPIVSLTRWVSVRLKKPGFEISKSQEITVRESMRVWGSIMIKVMQQKLGIL